VIGAIVASSGIDYVNLVEIVFFLKSALVVPLALAIFWRRMTGPAFIVSIVAAIAIGFPIRQEVSELDGLIALMGISIIGSVGISLLSRERFDYDSLKESTTQLEEETGVPLAVRLGAESVAAESA
jgi:hypothetical protein